MAQDWFEQNAPARKNGDWFEQNTPTAKTGAFPGNPQGQAVTAENFPGRATTAADIQNPAIRALSTVAEMFPTLEGIKHVYNTIAADNASPMPVLNMAKDMVLAPVQEAVQAGREIGEGDYASGVTRGAAMLVPFARKPIATAAAPIRRGLTEHLPNRLTASILKPDKASFDFGANAVESFNQSGIWGATLRSTMDRLKKTKGGLEAQLQGLAKANAGTVSNVVDAFTSSVDPIIAKARLDGKAGLARQIEKMRDNRINDIEARYGRYDLTPEELIAEKRRLAEDVTFTEDVAQQTLNNAKMSIYRALDAQLDTATKGKSKAINQQYAGLIEGQRLLENRIRAMEKSDLLKSRNILEIPLIVLEKFIPETLFKALFAQAARQR